MIPVQNFFTLQKTETKVRSKPQFIVFIDKSNNQISLPVRARDTAIRVVAAAFLSLLVLLAAVTLRLD